MTDSEGNEIGKLFVGGLSQATNNASLRIYFSRFGEVDDAVVMMDNKTGRSRGFGYVKYREPGAVNVALEAKPHLLDGKEVDAKQCNVNMKGRNRRSLKIFVGGIGLDQDAESIRNFFRQFGRVTDVNLMMDSNKQRHRGFAFVGFEDESVVKRLIGLHYVMMNTKQVEIKAMEPPNFGRRIGTSSTLSGTALINNNPTDGTCTANFENSTEVGNFLTPYTNAISYLPPQATCLPIGLSNSIRSHPINYYDHNHGAFGATLDNIYLSNSFTPTNVNSLKSTESVQQTENLAGNKQSIPMMIANTQYNQLTPTPTTMYTPISYQLLPPAYIAATQQPVGINPFLSSEKGTANWQIAALSPTSFQHWHSQHLISNNIPGSTFPITQNQSIGSSTASSDVPTEIGPIIAPYYTLCPQYAAVPIQPESSITASYSLQQPTTIVSTGDITSSSGTPSADDNRQEQGRMNRTAYPTILVAAAGNGVQNSTIINPANHILAQHSWNPTASNLCYSSLPINWNSTQSGIQQNYTNLPNGVLTQPVTMAVSESTCHSVFSKSTDELSVENQKIEIEMKSMEQDGDKLAKTQASGDTADNMMNTTEEQTKRHVERTRCQENNILSPNSWSGKWDDKVALQNLIGQPSTREIPPESARDYSSNNKTQGYTLQNNLGIEQNMNVTKNNVNNDRSNTDKLYQHPSEKAGQSSSQVTATSIRTVESNQKLKESNDSGFADWLYRKSTSNAKLEQDTNAKKIIHAHEAMELECQGPAGAAGDFHHSIQLARYSEYHTAR